MGKFGKPNIIRVAGVLIGTVLVAASAMAASHVENGGLRAKNLGVDMFITGANNVSLERKNLLPGTIGKGDCPLCYHRELLKNNKNSLPKGVQQSYPGE